MMTRSTDGQLIMRMNRLITVLMFSSSCWPIIFSVDTDYTSPAPPPPTPDGSVPAMRRLHTSFSVSCVLLAWRIMSSMYNENMFSLMPIPSRSCWYSL